MAGNNVINYDIKFNADTSNITSKVNELKTTFNEIKNMSFDGFMNMKGGGDATKLRQEYDQLKTTVQAVDTALTQAFNKDLGTLNVAKFNQSINSSVGGIQNVGTALNGIGSKGQQAFKSLATELLTVNHQLRQSNGFLTSMATTMANTIKWGVASSVMNSFTGTVKKAYGYVKHLDGSLNDIRIVTNKSAEEMDKFAVKANKVAQSLGQTTNAYTEAALIYYQQGLNDVDVEARANVTLKAANVTGQTGEEVSEQLTAVWNGYKVSAEESELYIDKLAAVAANSASNLEELSTGMSKVASAANAMGVDVDQLNAQLSTIISVTRQAPESVGTALKTIYARMSDLKLGKTDEEGIGLGDVSGTMESMGIDVMDATGNLRDMGDVIEDVAKKWDTWTEAQQTAMAQAMAGKRQYNNLVALFENWDMYEKSKDVSEGSAGTLQKQQDTYMESTEAHLKQLKAEWEDLYDSLLDSDNINGVVDGLTKVVNLMGAWVDGVGGGVNILAMLGSVAMNVFSRQIATSLTNTILKFQTSKQMAADLRAEMELTNQIDTSKANSSDLRVLVDMKKQQLAVTQAMTQQEYELANKMIEEKSHLQDQANLLREKSKEAQTFYNNTNPSSGTINTNSSQDDKDAAARQLSSMEASLRGDIKEIDKATEALNNLTSAHMKYEATKGTKGAKSDFNKEVAQTEKIVKNTAETMKEWATSGKVQGEEAERLKAIANELRSLDKAQLQTNDDRKKAQALMEEGRSINEKAQKSIKGHIGALRENDKALEDNARKVDQLRQRWSNFFQEINLRAQIQNFTTMISKVGQLASAANMAVSLGSIFKDDSLTAGEKFLRITMSLTTMIPMAINGIMGLSTAYNTFTASIRDSIAMSSIKKVLNDKELADTYKLNTAKLAEWGIDKSTTATDMIKQLIQKTGIELSEEEQKNLTSEIFLKKLDAAVTEGLITTDEKEAAMGAYKLAQDKLKHTSILKTIGLKLKEAAVYMFTNPVLMATVAITGLLVAGTYSLLKAEREKEKLLKEATGAYEQITEKVSNLTSRYSELTTEVNNFKDAISNYQEGIDALKTLDTNTEDYKEKLKEVNDEAKNLIETFGLWGQYDYTGGVITFKEGALENAIKQQEKEIRAVEQQLAFTKMSQEHAKLDVEAAKIVNAVGGRTVVTDVEKIYNQGGSGSGPYGHTGAENNGRYDTKVTVETDALLTKESVEKLSEILKTTKETQMESNENFDINSEEFQQAFLKAAKEADLATGQFDILQHNLSDGIIPMLDRYTGVLEEVEAASLHYAKEILGITIQEKFDEDILAAATDANGNVDYALAERLLQASEGYLGSQEFSEYDNKTITEITAEREAELTTKTNPLESNYDNLNHSGLVDTLISEAGSVEDFSSILLDAYGLSYTKGQVLTTQELLEQQLIKEGKTNVNITNKNGKLIASYDGDEGRVTDVEYTNKDVADQFSRDVAQGIIKKEQNQLIDQSLSQSQYSSMSDFYEDLKQIGPSEFGASAEQMQQVISDAFQNGELDLSSIFSTLSKTEVNALKGMSREQLIEDFNLSPDMVNTIETAMGKTLTEAVTDSLENYTEEDAFKAADVEGNQKAEKYDIDLDELDAYRDLLAASNEELRDNRDALNEVAVANKRMQKGVGELASGWDNFNKVMSDSNASAEDISSVLPEINSALQDVLNLDTEQFELLPPDFAKRNWKLINDVTNGVEGSVEKLRNVAGQEIIMTIDGAVDPNGNIDAGLLEIHNAINSFDSAKFEIGVGIDPTTEAEFYESCQSMINAAGMTQQKAEAYFGAMGYDVEFSDNPQTVEEVVANQVYTYEYDAKGEPIKRNVDIEFETITKTIDAPTIKTITPNGSYGGGVGVETTAPKSSTSKKSGGGGGGDKKPEKIDKMESEIDRYHDIENELKKLNTLLERQERIASKLTGKDRIAALQKQISLLQEQNEKQKEKLKLMQEEAAELKKKLQAEGVKFDAEGDISNYKALLKAKEDEINKMIDEANSKSSADAQEKIKEEIEKAKEEYEKLREWIERYEELIYDEMPGVEDAMQEAWDKQIELQIEAFEIEVKLQLDLQDTKRQINDFFKNMHIDEDDFPALQDYFSKQIVTYVEEGGTSSKNITEWENALKEYQKIKAGGISDIYGDDANAAWEAVLRFRDDSLESLMDVKDYIDQMEENYLNAIEAATEAFDDHVGQYEHIQSILEHNLKLIELLAGDEAYEAQIAYYEQQEKANLGLVEFWNQRIKFYQDQKAAVEEGSDAWKEANAKEKDAQKELNALVEQSVELIKTKYEKTVKKIIKDLNNAVTGGKGLDAMTQEWELINKEADMYLDTVNSAYEIQKLQNKALEAIDNASSLKAKQRLNEFMEKELGMLKDKEKLSKYEVDRANQLLDIEMKKIALEEAQRNKSTMRLRRDAQGNYSYQYVTDNDAVAKAQQELDEAQNSLYNLDKDAYKENLDQILSLWTEFQTKLNEIWTNNNLTEEQKQQQAYDLRERYMRMITSLTYDNENIRLNLENSVFNELARLRGMDIQDFQNMSDEEKRILLEQMIPQWNSGLQAMASQFSSEDGFIALMNQAFAGLQQNLKDYQDSLKNLEEKAGINFQTIISGAQDLGEETQKLIDQNKTVIKQQSDILAGLRKNIEETKKWVKEFENLVKKAEEALKLMKDIQEEENKKDNKKESDNKKEENKNNNKENNKENKSSRSDSSASTNNPPPPSDKDSTPDPATEEEHATVIGYVWTKSGANARIGKLWSNGAIQYKTTIPLASLAFHPVYSSAQQAPRGFKTGGYTGEWANGDSDGRLAVLHQKELVLNAKDTENILAAVDVVRSLNDSLNSRIFNLFNSSSIDKLVKMLEKGSDTPLEQNVQITANFPNVSVEREIEEAFNSLINSASQYAFNTLK